jgi:hypothetical protein
MAIRGINRPLFYRIESCSAKGKRRPMSRECSHRASIERSPLRARKIRTDAPSRLSRADERGLEPLRERQPAAPSAHRTTLVAGSTPIDIAAHSSTPVASRRHPPTVRSSGAVADRVAADLPARRGAPFRARQHPWYLFDLVEFLEVGERGPGP